MKCQLRFALFILFYSYSQVFAQRSALVNDNRGLERFYDERAPAGTAGGAGDWARPKSKKKSSDSLVMGLDLRNYKYEEPGFVEHSGMLYGAWGRYETTWGEGKFIAQTALHYGGLTYKGALCDFSGNCSPYETTNQKDMISKTNLEYAYQVSLVLSLKVGLGIRYLYDTVSETGFYQRTGLWGFIPLGFNYDYQVRPNIRITSEFEYDYIFYGGIKSNLSEVASNLQDIYLNQSGNGMAVALGFIWQDVYHLQAYYHTWNLNETEVANAGALTVQEPKNNSTSIGIKLGYDFF